jgi:hypothetical protein
LPETRWIRKSHRLLSRKKRYLHAKAHRNKGSTTFKNRKIYKKNIFPEGFGYSKEKSFLYLPKPILMGGEDNGQFEQ